MASRAAIAIAVAALLGLSPLTARAQSPSRAALDSVRAAAQPLLRRAEARVDSMLAAQHAESLRAAARRTRRSAARDTARTASAKDSTSAARVDTTHARRARAATRGEGARAQGAEPPLHLAADNMTGSHVPEGDEVLLNGNLRITRGRTLLTADNGRYLRAAGMLYLDGRVKMVDSATTVTCDHARYSENDDRLELNGNVVITDRDAELHAPAGIYDRNHGRADLFGGVNGHDRKQKLFSDTAVYFRDSTLVQARGHVRGLDEENKLELNARAIDYNRETREAVATGAPVLRSRDDKGHESRLYAVKLKVNADSRVAEALDSVRVQRDTLQATGDYARFDDKADRGWLIGHPRAWDNETNITGDTLEVWTEKRVLRRVVVRHSAVMDYRGSRAENLGEASKLTGARSDVFFTDERIDSLMAVGQARNQYTAAPKAGKTAEENIALGDTITVYFKDRKVERARVTGNASGEYHAPVAVGDTLALHNEIVRYDGLSIEFVVPKNKIVLDEAAHLTYRELELHSRRVEFDSGKQTLVAEGKPQLVDHGDKVSGHLMTYDLESRTGTIYQATTRYERGLYHGEAIRKAGDNVLDVQNGSYSTCDAPEPHYHFSAHWMKIYLKDKLVAKPVVFYIRNVPLLALPFYVFPIKPGRHSGFLFPQFEFGLNNRAGQFIRNAGYYWAPNDYMDLSLSGDYYQAQPSWVLRGESVYKLLYKLDGDMRGSFARNDQTKHDDYDFSADHTEEISPRTRLVARASFVSSRDYSTSALYGRYLAQRLDRFLTSSLALSHNADWASINAVLDRRQDLNADDAISDPDGLGPLHGPPPGTVASLSNLTESTPSLSINFPTRTIGSLGLLHNHALGRALSSMYFSLNSQFLSQHTRTAYVSGQQFFTSDSVLDSTTVLGQRVETRRGFSANSSLSDSRRLFGWLNFAPRVSANGVIFDHDELGHKVVPTGTWSADFGTGTSLYGLFRPPIHGLEGIRHVISPSVSFSFSPEFKNLTFVDSSGVRRNRFQPFGGIGVSGFKSSRLNFSLDQRFQVKLRHGDQIERLDNLLSWTLSGGYDFLYRDHQLPHGLSVLGSSVRLQPPGVFAADLSWATDVYNPRPVRSLGYNLGLNLASGGHRRSGQSPDLPVEQTANRSTATEQESFLESWSLGLAYSYSGGYSVGTIWGRSETANAVAHYRVTPNWSLDYSTSYDVTGHNVLTQRYGLHRDIHCWEASFTRSFTTGGETEYYFRLGIKDQREFYLERGTRLQSFGGIQ